MPLTYRLSEHKIHSKTYERRYAGIPPTEYTETLTFLARIMIEHRDGDLSWMANGMFEREGWPIGLQW